MYLVKNNNNAFRPIFITVTDCPLQGSKRSSLLIVGEKMFFSGLYSRMFLGTADLRIFNPKIYRPAGGSASPKPHCFSSGWLAASPET